MTAIRYPLPAFLKDLLQTKHLIHFDPWVTQCFPLGHPEISTGSPKVFHWVTQAASVFPITATCPGWPWMTAITRDHGDLKSPFMAIITICWDEQPYSRFDPNILASQPP